MRVSKVHDTLESHLNQRRSNKNYNWLSECLIKIQIDLIDENDNIPVFTSSSYTDRITENAQPGTLLQITPKLDAIDLDSNRNDLIKYSIINSDNDDDLLFTIDDQTGLILLTNSTHLKLDREIYGDWLNLIIRASDSGIESKVYTDTIVSINILDLNDNRPEFDSKVYYVSIEENVPIGFVIIRLNTLINIQIK